ncbi:MAG: HDOD domain-containing protein [Gammaproteobacteria bacterium]|nr:HDOD domain-containing protein [Gammaproteobacteria bacterium]
MPVSLQEWTEQLTSGTFPVLRSTIDNLNALYADENVGYRGLASAVMSDPGMVANTIQIANQDQKQRLHQSIHTVEHALMKLGMDRASNLHTDLPILEDMLKERSVTVRNHIMGVYERSHHAAYQAMDLVRRMGDPEPGEVYVATFLSGLGEILIWLYVSDSATQVLSYQRDNDVTPEEAQHAVLGFSYAEMTRAIVDKLELSPLLSQLLEREKLDNPRCLGMLLAIRLSYLAQYSWYNEDMLQCMADIAEFLRQPLEIATTIVHSNAALAARHHQYSIPAAASLLPLLSHGLPTRLLDETAERVAQVDFPSLLSHEQLEHIVELSKKPEIDYEMVVQEAKPSANVVQELTIKQPLEEGHDTELIITEDEEGDDTYIISFEEHDRKLEEEGICPVPDEHSVEEVIAHLARQIDQSISMPEIMKLVMEGMHDGLGLTRVAFTMLTPDRKMLKTRAVMSKDADWDIRHLHIPLEPENLFSHLMSRPQALWLSDENVDKIWQHVPAELTEVLHKDGFYAMSVYVKNRPVGLFYADRYNHEHHLDEHTYDNFKLLCRHASKAMVELSRG